MSGKKLGFLSGVLFLIILFAGCGSSAEQERKKEEQDSIRLENERRELIERASRMYEGSSSDSVSKADSSTD